MGRRSKSKIYFYFTIICTLLLIFLYNFEVLDAWVTTKFSSSLLLSSTSADLLQQQQDHQQYLEYQNTKHVEQFDDEANSTKLSATKIPQPESQLSKSDLHLSPQSQQQQVNLIVAPKPIETLEKPWFFKHGDYYPKPAKVPKKQLGKKAHLQGSRLFPYQDPHSDRIVNQLMYVPPNYEEVRSSGKLKEILLYNGLFPWNIKAGTIDDTGQQQNRAWIRTMQS